MEFQKKFFQSIGIIFISLSIFGAYKSFTFLPYWDMWESYLNFYSNFSLNNFSTIWKQHNEHRIVIAKFFFIIDHFLFNGRIWFLIFLNFISIGFIILFFSEYLRKLNLNKIQWLIYFIMAWLYSFIQQENLTWGFQVQFYFVFLTAIGSIFFLQQTGINKSIFEKNFFISLILSILSALTMGNGQLIMYINTLYLFCINSPKKKIFIFLLTALITTYLYFFNYISPTDLGLNSFTYSLKNNLSDMLIYTFLYLGNPFYYLTGKGVFGYNMAIFFGIFLILSSLFFLIKSLLTKYKKNKILLSLIFFIFFIIGTAFLTSGGRIMYGLQQALSSRYTTPSLIAWVSLFILYIHFLKTLKIFFFNKIIYFFMILIILMFPRQLKVFENKDIDNFNKKIAGVALELRVNDLEQFNYVYHSPNKLLTLTSVAFKKDLSFFGVEPYKNLYEKININISDDFFNYKNNCNGKIEEIKLLKSLDKYNLIEGKIVYQTNNKNFPKYFLVLSADKKVTGIVLTFKIDNFNNDGRSKTYYFKGYSNKKVFNNFIFLNEHNCFF